MQFLSPNVTVLFQTFKTESLKIVKNDVQKTSSAPPATSAITMQNLTVLPKENINLMDSQGLARHTCKKLGKEVRNMDGVA